jgi:hypothetical protein
VPLTLDPKALQASIDPGAVEQVSAAYDRLLEAQANTAERNRQAVLAHLRPLVQRLEPKLFQTADIKPEQLRQDLGRIWVGDAGGSAIGYERDASGIIINYDTAAWVRNVQRYMAQYEAHFVKMRTFLAPLIARQPELTNAAPFSRVVPRDGSAPLEMSMLHQVRGLFSRVETPSSAASAPSLAPCLDHEHSTPPFPIVSSAGLSPGADSVGSNWISLYNRAEWDAAPHKSGLLAAPFIVRPTDTHVTVIADTTTTMLDLFASGIGIAHAWSQLHLSVSDGTTELASETVQLGNATNAAGGTGWLPQATVQSRGLQGTPTQLQCAFTRQAADPTAYVISLQASVDATVMGTAAASCLLMVRLDKLTAHCCT